MTDQLRKIIRPKPVLVSLEIAIILIFNCFALGFYLTTWFSAITLSHKANYLFWIGLLLINQLALTVVIDSLTHYLTSGYELTKESLIIVKTGWGKKPKTEIVHFENVASVEHTSPHRVELKVKHSGQPKICRILGSGQILCQEVKDHFRVYNLNQLSQSDIESNTGSISLTNTPRFVVMDQDFLPLPTDNQE